MFKICHIPIILTICIGKDPDEKVMDAKVLRKGDKKLIIVEAPNPKEKWLQHEDQGSTDITASVIDNKVMQVQRWIINPKTMCLQGSRIKEYISFNNVNYFYW